MPREKLIKTEAQMRAARRAIKKAGGPAGLARALLPDGHTYQDRAAMATKVRMWRDVVGIPPRWVTRVNDITGVSRYSMAPDVFRRGD